MSVKSYIAQAVETIKTAILQSQYGSAKLVNMGQLSLYFGIGKYISENSRKGYWGTGAIDQISDRLQKDLPGLRGFSATSIKKCDSSTSSGTAFQNPMGVATYKTQEDIRRVLPKEEDLLKLLKDSDNENLGCAE